MSVYTVSTDKNILNMPKLLEGLDVSTRNQYFATIVGLDAGVLNRGKLNVFVGYKTGNKNRIGINNVYIGAQAGQNALESDNILIGTNTGQFMFTGKENIFLGNDTGRFLTGNKNILIGFQNTVLNDFNSSSNNIGIGNDQTTVGYNNISIGRDNVTLSSNSTILGTRVENTGLNNLLIGNYIENHGSNVCIVKNAHGSTTYINNSNNYTNFNDILISELSSNNKMVTTVNGDFISLQGKFAKFVVGEKLELETASNVRFTIDPDFTYIGGSNQRQILIFGSNMSLSMTSSNISLSNTTSGLALGSCNVSLGGSNISTIAIYASNNYIDINNDKVYIQGNTDIHGKTDFYSNVNLMKPLCFTYQNTSNHHWCVFLDSKSVQSSDLIFHSKNNTTITFTDDFQSELLNFTGKHRCNISSYGKKDMQGMVVCSTGEYIDLDGRTGIRIDEAIPIVQLCKKAFDETVFGVVCNMETDDNYRKFMIGNLQFSQKKKIHDTKVVVNSHGEGAIWVTNINGNFKNGDLITSSCIPGYGMCQGDNIIRSYTIGKITCDCNFSFTSKIYSCKAFKYKNVIYKKAFVGCVYKM